MKSDLFTLSWMISPTDVEDFKIDNWERRFFAIERNCPNYYANLFSLTEADSLLSTTSLQSSWIRIVNQGKETPLRTLQSTGLGPRATLLESLYAQHRDGSTLVMQSIHERCHAVKNLCQSLAKELSANIHVNVYLTPPDNGGLATHYDTHDVFVLQIHGSKHWKVYDRPTQLPLTSQPFKSDEAQVDNLFKELILQQGDMMYLPRGVHHAAVAGESTSMHLTIGIHTITWGAVFLGAMQELICKDRRFRESLPPGFATKTGTFSTAKKKFSNLRDNMFEGMNPDDLIRDAAKEALLSMQVSLDGHLLDLQLLSSIDSQTPIFRRQDIICELAKQGDLMSLRFHGKTVEMPGYLKSDVNFMMNTDEFRAVELPGDLDVDERLLLVRRLVTEGFLTLHAI